VADEDPRHVVRQRRTEVPDRPLDLGADLDLAVLLC
jgi:hypothetical protein